MGHAWEETLETAADTVPQAPWAVGQAAGANEGVHTDLLHHQDLPWNAQLEAYYRDGSLGPSGIPYSHNESYSFYANIQLT